MRDARVNLAERGVEAERPWIVAGPCSAETEDQVVGTARQLARLGTVHAFRAGVWKPRTRPAMFEGMGTKALAWLRTARQETGLPLAVEVATSRHVEQALAGGIDILWVGARTTANPFAVQEVADALKGVDVHVLVKNPVSPDLDLWIGALERINSAGVTHLSAVHRGFASYEKTRFRNTPHWEIPIELQRRVPGLQMICDPSHICGRTDTLQEVAQTALDLNFGGLMMESHLNPQEALSDASQQMTPDETGSLLSTLIFRRQQAADPETRARLEELRETIDGMDLRLLEILAARMAVAERIGAYKRENNVSILQASRWDEIVRTRITEGRARHLSEDFLMKLFEGIHQESIARQAKVMRMETGDTVRA